MKIIDLLNKIANGEIYTGTHVIYRDKEYIFTGGCLENIGEKYSIAMFGLDNLNNEVEIIEDKKIKHMENYVDFANLKEDEKFDYLYEMESRIIDKLNSMEE